MAADAVLHAFWIRFHWQVVGLIAGHWLASLVMLASISRVSAAAIRALIVAWFATLVCSLVALVAAAKYHPTLHSWNADSLNFACAIASLSGLTFFTHALKTSLAASYLMVAGASRMCA